MSDLFNKKVRRNYRSKARDSDEEIPNEQESLYEQGAKGTFNAPSDASGVKKSKSVLSFEDDLDPDDGDEFKVKKSNLSRRLNKQTKEHKKKRPSDSDNVIKVVSRKEPIEKKPEPPEEPVDPEENLERLRKQLLDLAEEEDQAEPAPVSDGVKVNPLLQIKSCLTYVEKRTNEENVQSYKRYYP
ncbi:unnamed protein product [Echinostoma caproni]|uniref:RAD26 n=1 Tax=Echinostoma caproni TaxID=27848 RepID=A0A183B714_9TREM|nr:unnamed protein product [Echinostoma caproni]